MAEQKAPKKNPGQSENVKEIEVETKDIVATSKIWIYVIIGLLG
mgnify:FL=1